MESTNPIASNAMEFCRQHVWLRGVPISFEARPYLPAIYGALDGNLVLRCSRQVEKSTLLANAIVYFATTYPGIEMLLVCPREEQANLFCRSRLEPLIKNSPLIGRALLGRNRNRRHQVHNQLFANGSKLHVRSAFRTADAARGISADVLMIDEFQDMSAGDLPVLQETLSHSPRGQTILTGTPKLADNQLDDMFRRSTSNEWHIPCAQCSATHIPDARIIGPDGLICPECRTPLSPNAGTWVPRNPNSTWGHGFWVNHLMVPWVTIDSMLRRQQEYDVVRFTNECLGLPVSLGDHVITRAEIEACCGTYPMAQTIEHVPAERRRNLVAGIDWGGGARSATVLVIGEAQPNLVFTIYLIERLPSREDPAQVVERLGQRCQEFGVSMVAADGGGNGLVYNRLLASRIGMHVPIYGLIYSSADQVPVRDGALYKWTVNRSATIGAQFTRIKKGLVRFPRVEDCGTFLDEFTCEVAEYDDEARAIRFTHPEFQPDDTLHAANYAQQLALRSLFGQRQ